MAKYLVTGGCGFIGSHLVDHLVELGNKVIVLDNLSTGKKSNLSDSCELIVGDIRDKSIVKRSMARMDGCFHLAADTSGFNSELDWMAKHKINMEASINLLEVATRDKTPVVYASSYAVYGSNIEMPLREQSVTKPVTAYGADKLSTEHHARIASFVHQVPTLGLRFFNVYGPRQDSSSPYSGVISIFSELMKNNQDISIFGDGQQTRDFIYVGDVVNFLLSSMRYVNLASDVINVCTGKATSINQLVKILYYLTDSGSKIQYRPQKKGDIFTSVGDPSLAQRRLFTHATYSLYDGLRELLSDDGLKRFDIDVA